MRKKQLSKDMANFLDPGNPWVHSGNERLDEQRRRIQARVAENLGQPKPLRGIRPRGVGPRPGTPKSVRTEGARLIAKLRAKKKPKRAAVVPYEGKLMPRLVGWRWTLQPIVGVQDQ